MSAGGWRFAFSRRWLGYLAFVVVFAIACVLLSMWQFARREEARAEVIRVEQNWDAAAVPLSELVPDPAVFDPDDKYRSVEVTGTYLSEEQLLVRGRPRSGQVGFEVLVPLLLEDGSVFIVDRGWVPGGDGQDAPDSVPSPPSGTVTVTARLKAGEPVIPGRSAPDGQVATINLPQIAERIGRPTVEGAYGLVASEDPSVAAAPAPAIRPEPDEGPHLSYALQWIAFGVMGFVGLAWAVRHEYRLRNEDDPAVRERAARREARAKRRPTDADVEDALLDR